MMFSLVKYYLLLYHHIDYFVIRTFIFNELIPYAFRKTPYSYRFSEDYIDTQSCYLLNPLH